jgi:Mg2+ and Co2+ transporter CorA
MPETELNDLPPEIAELVKVKMADVEEHLAQMEQNERDFLQFCHPKSLPENASQRDKNDAQLTRTGRIFAGFMLHEIEVLKQSINAGDIPKIVMEALKIGKLELFRIEVIDMLAKQDNGNDMSVEIAKLLEDIQKDVRSVNGRVNKVREMQLKIIEP